MKSSLEEIKIRPRYTFKLELSQEELNSFYLVLNYSVDPKLKNQLNLSDKEFDDVEKINSAIFNEVRKAVQKCNDWETP